MNDTAVSIPSAFWLRFDVESPRARTFFSALTSASGLVGITCKDGRFVDPNPEWLLLWGPGHPTRIEPIRRQLASLPTSGRSPHVIMADLAYWNHDAKVRISIDTAHPQKWVMKRDWPSGRWQRDPAHLSDRSWKPNGPILIAGVGRKAQVQYGPVVSAWEADIVSRIRVRWPDRAIYYRPKRQNESPVPPGAKLCRSGQIESVLNGCSLVCTWHSNVAIDAIRMGIPAICRDGAAAAICPSDLSEQDPLPLDPDLRLRFLQNLAWFQWGWTDKESRGCWEWLLELLEC